MEEQMSERMPNLPDLPPGVVDAIDRFVEHLLGRGDALELDSLAPDIREAVEALMPVIAAEVLSNDVDTEVDIADWNDDPVVEALGLHPVSGRVRLRGDAVRRARESAGLSHTDLARLVSGRGVTIDGGFIDSIERVLGTAVDPRVADAIAGELGVDRRGLTFTEDDVDTATQNLVTEVRWARPDIEVRSEPILVGRGRKPLVALHLSHLGFVARVALFDVDEEGLSSPDVLAAAAATIDLEPEVAILLAAATSEWPTQIVDAADLADAYVAPSGDRLRVPRRPLLPIGDAVRLLFEETLPLWDDVELAEARSDAPLAAMAVEASRLAVAKAVAGRPRLEPKIRGVGLVRDSADPIAAALGRLIEEVRDGELHDELPARLAQLVPSPS
jgi:hypothetical protein